MLPKKKLGGVAAALVAAAAAAAAAAKVTARGRVHMKRVLAEERFLMKKSARVMKSASSC